MAAILKWDDEMAEGDLIDVAKTNKVPTTVESYVIRQWTPDFPELVLTLNF